MSDPICRYDEPRALVDLVKDATELIRSKGEAAFDDFRIPRYVRSVGCRSLRRPQTQLPVIDEKHG